MTAGRTPLEIARSVAPKLAQLTDDVLFADVWERPGLSKRDRSMITIASLVALNRPEQLRLHLRRGLANGVTEAEIGEMLTHLAFYAGWPAALSAVVTAGEVFDALPGSGTPTA
jgi:4-carboxymuconolactone decarboxylase